MLNGRLRLHNTYQNKSNSITDVFVGIVCVNALW